MWNDLIKLVYPDLCFGCGEPPSVSEKNICAACFDKIAFCPYTWQQMHPVEKIFWGRCRIDAAQSLLLFNKHGIAQNMLHRLKYQGEKNVGEFLGALLGKKLREHPLMVDADCIVPLPLHQSKFRQRGYNQSEVIATGIASEMPMPVYGDLLSRPQQTESQTRKSRSERFENVSNAFRIDLSQIKNFRKVILVDDVITTGATLEACLQLLEPHCKVSVATVAYQ